MAIIQEHFQVEGRDLIRSYSDKNVFIHGGAPESDYIDAVDPAELNRQYTETDIPIDADEDDDYATAGKILMGVEG